MIEGDMTIEEAETLIESVELNRAIDPMCLDDELLRQPTLVGRYGEALACVVRARDRHVAKLDATLRREYLTAKGKDPSESYIKSQIDSDDEYIDLSYLKARAEAALDSIKTKRNSIDKFQEGAIAEIYDIPKSTRNYKDNKWNHAEEAVKKIEKDQREQLNKTIKRRTK